MAIRTFNSVGGFSVGEIPTNVIDPNGVGSFTTIKTNNLQYANGEVWDLQEAAGSNGYIQFNTSNNFAATGNLLFTYGVVNANASLTTLDTLTVGGNIVSTNITANETIGANVINVNTVTAGNIDAGNIVLSGDFSADGNVSIGGNVDITGDMNVGTITGNLVGNVTGNFSGNITGDVSFSAPGNISEILFTDAKYYGNGDQMYYGNGAPMTSLSSAAGIRYKSATSNVEIDGNIVLANTAVSNVKAINFETGGQVLDSNANVIIASSNKQWTFNSDGELLAPGNVFANVGLVSSQTLKATSTANLVGAVTMGSTVDITGAANISGILTVSNSATITGDANVTGTVNADTVSTVDLALSGFVTTNLIPAGSEALDLGSASNPWKDLWLSGNSIRLGSATISTTGTGSNIVTTANQSITGTLTINNIDAYGHINVGDGTVNSNANATLRVYGITTLSNTASTTDALTGALVVAGGVGVGGNIYVTGNATVASDLAVSGSASITGDTSITGNAGIGGNLVISGNLTVSGTTTYVNTTNSSIKDALIDLGGAGSGADISSNDGKDRGIILHNYYGAVNNQFIGWKTVEQEFQLLTDTSVTGEVATGNLATLRVDTLYGTVKTDSQPNIGNMSGLFDIAVSNLADIETGNVTTAYIGTLTASGLLYPIADGAAPATNEVTVLKTNGANTLGFSTIHTDRIANANSSVFVNTSNVTVTANGISAFKVIETGANVTGILNASTSVDTPTVNASTEVSTPKVTIGDTAVYAQTFTTTDIASATLVAVDVTNCRAIEFFVKGEDTVNGKYTVATITAIHNGLDVMSTHNKLNFSDLAQAGTFAVEFLVVDSVDTVQLKVIPSSSDNTVWTTQFRTI